MTEIFKQFTYDESSVIVLGTVDNPYFKARDVATMLGYANTRKAIKDHVDEEDIMYFEDLKNRGNDSLPPIEGVQDHTKFINESGVYSLIFGSKLETSKKFKRWITGEVLPSIRKTGKYEISYKTVKPMLTFKIENEDDLHRKTVNFIRQYNERKILFTSTLGELQDTPEKRISAWRKGYTKGMPDLIIFNQTSKFNGCVVEFKSPKCTGELSDEQQEIIDHFELIGYKTIVSCNYDDIIVNLIRYFDDIRITCNKCGKTFKNENTMIKHINKYHT